MELLQADNSVIFRDDPVYKHTSTQTNNSLVDEELTAAKERIAALELEVKVYEQKLEERKSEFLARLKMIGR